MKRKTLSLLLCAALLLTACTAAPTPTTPPTTMAYIPMQKESFYSDDAVQSDIEVIGPYTVGGFDATMEVYSEIFTDLSMSSVLTTTFTDSWYGYTILLKTAEKLT